MKFECVLAGVCLSDYWSGHHLPHVQIPVWRGMTGKQIKDAIKSEIIQGAVAGSNDDAWLLSSDWVSDRGKDADRVTKAVYAAINRMRPNKKGQRKFFTDLEEDSEDSESVYAFFVFVRI